MEKVKICFCSALALSLALFLPCYGQTPRRQNSAPAASIVKTQKICSIHNVRLGMNENKVEDILGAPTYKSGGKTVWHYRHLFKESKGKSDPQIKFSDGRVVSVIGSALNLNGQPVLMNGDDEKLIERTLGPCQEIRKGANSRTAAYTYYQYRLQIITKDTKIAVINLGIE